VIGEKLRDVMKGFVFHGPGQSSWEEVPDPGVKDPADVIVRIDAVTICGTDLHMFKGDVSEVRPARSSATRRSERSWKRAPTCVPYGPGTASWSPASPPADAARTAARPCTASAGATEAGSSAT
jgi:hypothetical protein